jgi:hypothetical protein
VILMCRGTGGQGDQVDSNTSGRGNIGM